MRDYRFYFSVFGKKFCTTITASNKIEAVKLFDEKLKERTVIDDIQEPYSDGLKNIRDVFGKVGLNI